MKIATMERMNDQIENTLETLRKENRALEKTLEMLDSKPITKDNRKRYSMIERQIAYNSDMIAPICWRMTLLNTCLFWLSILTGCWKIWRIEKSAISQNTNFR